MTNICKYLMTLGLMIAAFPAHATVLELQGQDSKGRECNIQLSFDEQSKLISIKFAGVIVEILHFVDGISGRGGRIEYEASFDSANNFLNGTFTLQRGPLGRADLISGVGYRMPYDPDRYANGYNPTSKQTLTFTPYIQAPESFKYHAADLFVGPFPLQTVDLECHDLH